jgi:SGNH hydrolase-like domain, acetyltransferase AlgX
MQLAALALAAAGGYFLGAYYNHARTIPGDEPITTPIVRATVPPPKYELTPGFPPIDLPPVAGVADDAPRARAMRAEAIRRAADAIRSECRNAAGGDWEKWQLATAPYRAALKAKLDTLEPVVSTIEGRREVDSKPLVGLNQFPLFEIGPQQNLNYLYDPPTMDQFGKDRAVVAAQRWLRQWDIDLVFVAVAKMTEVHVDHFIEPSPADGIIAPHVRRALLELLEQDVEVVDGLSLLRPQREPDPDYLYNTCDSHWAPRGMRVMAKEIADRMLRYSFGTRARYALPLFTALPVPYYVNGYAGGLGPIDGFMSLSPEQRQRARAVQTTVVPGVRPYDGQPLLNDPQSPVLLIGNSFVEQFEGQFVRELNLRIRSRWAYGQTTEAFGDFVRDPNLLAGVRVVVWITTNHHTTHFKPMPQPILPANKGSG